MPMVSKRFVWEKATQPDAGRESAYREYHQNSAYLVLLFCRDYIEPRALLNGENGERQRRSIGRERRKYSEMTRSTYEASIRHSMGQTRSVTWVILQGASWVLNIRTSTLAGPFPKSLEFPRPELFDWEILRACEGSCSSSRTWAISI